MNDNRKSGAALICGTILMLVTMSIHPTGHDLLAPGRSEAIAVLNVIAHSLALASMPILFLGALGLTRRMTSPDRLAISALVTYGFSLVAGMVAAIASGFIAPRIAREMAAADSATAAQWRLFFVFNGHINQAFALVLVMLSSAAIVLWSIGMIIDHSFGRAVALYGLIIGPLIMIAVGSGHVRLNVHGFGLVIIAQAIWFIIAGLQLWRLGEPSRT